MQKTLQIRDTKFIIDQFGAKKGSKVLFRLVKTLGPVMAGLVKGGGFTGDGLGMALSHFAESSKEEDFDYLCEAFAEVTKIKRKLPSGDEIELELKDHFDQQFKAHYGDLMIWLATVITHNFASFLGEMVNAESGEDLLSMLGLIRLKSNPPKG